MKVLHPTGQWVSVIVLALIILPLSARDRSPDVELPDGVCGNSERMLEASKVGRAMVQQALATGMPWGDKALNEYVNRLGQNMARSSGSQQVFAFYVVYNPAVNAQAFPGGYIVVNSGVISLAESEAELASVLSHEIAHENSCDWRTTPWKGRLFELIVLVPTVIVGGPVGIAVLSASGLTAPAARARSNRLAEERADRLAAQYLVRAGYDPHAAVEFFRRLQREEDRGAGEPGGLLATHPRSVERQKQLEKIIPNLPPLEIASHDETEFLRLQRAVRDYDEIYSRVTGVRLPGHDAPPPELSRRSSSPPSP